jgi:threonine dehydratase
VHAVEPEGYDDMAQSLAAQARRRVTAAQPTVCDALRAPTPGAIPFAICKELVAEAHTVNDSEVMRAVAVAASHLKLVVEPSGAAALAVVLRLTGQPADSIGLILSGGNVDRSAWLQALATYDDI